MTTSKGICEKLLALATRSEKMGFGAMRVMADVSAERYWTVVSEMEVSSLEECAETPTRDPMLER